METDQSALVQQNNGIQSADTPELLVSDDANLIGHNGSMVGLSPVQIQQEYFENLADCDWVKWVWYLTSNHDTKINFIHREITTNYS